MTLTYETADIVLRLLQILVLPAMIWVLRSFTLINKEIAALRERLSTAEARLNDVPSGNELHDISLSVVGLRGDIKGLDERLTGVDRLVERMERIVSRQETYLLNGVRK
jgi:hypothetical protein